MPKLKHCFLDAIISYKFRSISSQIIYKYTEQNVK